jgi:DNA-binding CsgD family transcriptional regulator
MLAPAGPQASSMLVDNGLGSTNERPSTFAELSHQHFETMLLARSIPWGVLIVDEYRRLLSADHQGQAALSPRCGSDTRGEPVHTDRVHANPPPEASFEVQAIGTGENADDQTDLSRNCSPWGVLIVDDDCRILFSNRRSRIFLMSGDGLEEWKGRVRVERSSSDRSFRDLVHWATSGGVVGTDAPSGSNTIGVPGREGHVRFAIRVVPCSHDGTGRAALVIIADLAGGSHMDRASAMGVFRLSEREAHFAELFAAGCRIDTIAERMGIAVNTARVHLRNVFTKTGCSNQIELARKLAQLP